MLFDVFLLPWRTAARLSWFQMSLMRIYIRGRNEFKKKIINYFNYDYFHRVRAEEVH